MTLLVDSDILIEVTRGKNKEILQRWEDLSNSEDVLLCSPVSIAELWHGARPSEHEVLNNLFRALTCIPIDAQVGHRAGAYLHRYAGSHSMELGDALIAATAALNHARLWTRNRKHYPMKDVAIL